MADIIQQNINLKPQPIFRFNFKEEIMGMITHFAKIHQHDDRKTYKEQWTTWFDTNSLVLEEEINRLMRIGYIGNVEYKMFNAGRYYFRKKTDNNKKNADHNEAAAAEDMNAVAAEENIQKIKPTRVYISTAKAILDAMDQHIRSLINTNNFTPAEGYNQFCKTHTTLLSVEIKRIYKTINSNDIENKNSAALIIQKLKKTYKNRYFILTHK